MFLTLFGIVLGLVMGRLLHAWLVLTVEVDLVMFGRTAPAYAYVLAAVLTAVFSVMVNVAADTWSDSAPSPYSSRSRFWAGASPNSRS